jgi:hypothetical protein
MGFKKGMIVHPESAKLSAGNFSTKQKWHSENLNYFPAKKEQFEDLDAMSKEFIWKGAGPSSPIFEPGETLVTMGSCFADRLRRWLNRNGKNATYIAVPEGLNNSFAVRQYLEWALTGDRSTDAYWYDNDPELGAYKYEPQQEHAALLKHFKNVNGVVVTFGLGEVWKDIETDNVFWRGVPADSYDEQKHKCVTTTVQENVDNMVRIAELIKQHAGRDKKIIFTLSPVPLNATFTKQPTMLGDCVSKSILRVALDQFFRETQLSDVYYWPSFEMVRWVGAHTDIPTLFEDNTTRHVNNDIVKIIIDNFVEKFFK